MYFVNVFSLFFVNIFSIFFYFNNYLALFNMIFHLFSKSVIFISIFLFFYIYFNYFPNVVYSYLFYFFLILQMKKHIFRKDSISSCGIIHKYMRNSADKFSILNHWASTHSLNNAVCLFQKLLICNMNHHSF